VLTSSTPQSATESIALLDIGSNALRCVVARLDARPGFEIAQRQRFQTRLRDSETGLGTAVDRQSHGLELGQCELGELTAWLQPMPLQERADLPGLEPERADVIVPGAIVFEELLSMSGYPALTVSRTSVREGVLWREAQKLGRQ
jgi:exopolyphosphatase/guanosine-5'-triphosphate,3'-diphosphate pyrophosphatase